MGNIWLPPLITGGTMPSVISPVAWRFPNFTSHYNWENSPLPCLITGDWNVVGANHLGSQAEKNNCWVLLGMVQPGRTYLTWIQQLPVVQHGTTTHDFYLLSVLSTWWLIQVSKWIMTPVISELTLLSPVITRGITYLLSGGEPPSSFIPIQPRFHHSVGRNLHLSQHARRFWNRPLVVVRLVEFIQSPSLDPLRFPFGVVTLW